MTDEILLAKIAELRDRIFDWAKVKGFCDKFEFSSYADFHNDEPYENFACVMVIWVYGDPYNFLNRYADSDLLDEFEALITTTEFDYEMYNESVIQFFCKDELLNQLYLSYFRWQWICKLIEPDYTSLYQEVFDYFNKNLRRLGYLRPRKFEILISEIFKNQGYYTKLGAGWNDGGVDLRIYQKDDIDQLITLVQVKRQSAKNPIRLGAVAAFYAVVEEEKANRGLFITTTRYLPQAKKFAARQNKKLILASSSDIGSWCDKARAAIVRDRNLVIKDDYILSLLSEPIAQRLEGKIVKNDTTIDPNASVNDFCMILKDSQNVSLLMRIPARAMEKGNFRSSHEIPVLDSTILQYKCEKNIFRARKWTDEEGQIIFWGQHTQYTLWDGEPQYFDCHSPPPNNYVKKLWILKGESYDERSGYSSRFLNK